MTETEKLGLKKPDASDIYADFIPQIFSDNMDAIDSTVSALLGRFGGLGFARLSQEDFGAMEAHDPDTVYYVTDGKGGVEQYLGDVKLSGGSGAPTAAISAKGLIGKMGLAEAYTEE